jgi:hypothetical protein
VNIAPWDPRENAKDFRHAIQAKAP